MIEHKITVTHEADATTWRCTCDMVRRLDAGGMHLLQPSREPEYQHTYGEGGVRFGRVTATTINYDALARELEGEARE